MHNAVVMLSDGRKLECSEICVNLKATTVTFTFSEEIECGVLDLVVTFGGFLNGEILQFLCNFVLCSRFSHDDYVWRFFYLHSPRQ